MPSKDSDQSAHLHDFYIGVYKRLLSRTMRKSILQVHADRKTQIRQRESGLSASKIIGYFRMCQRRVRNAWSDWAELCLRISHMHKDTFLVWHDTSAKFTFRLTNWRDTSAKATFRLTRHTMWVDRNQNFDVGVTCWKFTTIINFSLIFHILPQ